MAIIIKTKEEIEKMRQGGEKLARILEELKKEAKPGIKTIELDRLAEKLVLQAGGQPSFKTVRDYQWTTCLCVNNVVVHGIPNDYQLKVGDLLGIDIGMIYEGFHTDLSETIIIGQSVNLSDLTNFLSVGKKALVEAIAVAKPGNRIGHISQAIQGNIEKAGFSVVKSLTGHGVGRKLHEDPRVPGFLERKIEETPEIKEGMVLAIEVIYNQGGPEVIYTNDDGWTIGTKNGSLSGLFEQTVAITGDGPKVLTWSA